MSVTSIRGFHALALALIAFIATPLRADEPLNFILLEELVHDDQQFTQGLELDGDVMYESSGLTDKSFVRSYRVDSGEVIQETHFPGRVFAEGITLFNNKLYLLTWRNGILFTLNPTTLQITGSKKYRGEGWGIAHTDTELVMSDGSPTLTFRDPASFKPTRTLQVTGNEGAIRYLNELEYAKGAVWANRWQTTLIYRIDPKTGTVTGVLDLAALVPSHLKNSYDHVLNGIAYDADKDAFWVTGKKWPVRYLIKILPGSKSAE
ncbi:glutaminyl-peptide cyclotransferase [Teredinibacter turnerae]|uniref:glutaminyl-peptide cyclotransferase n=1 Tax=Teredinibacter turnerae TaxID=2426 RepID=UPI0003717144|nr:glutaminyl-peptide cyclotransferase [Teredinibacter turnerae]